MGKFTEVIKSYLFQLLVFLFILIVLHYYSMALSRVIINETAWVNPYSN